MIFNILSFLAVISLIVFVHELGHYLLALSQGVKVEVFSIGLGPEICAWSDRRGTKWRIAIFPVGGYVKMFGDINPASQPDPKLLASFADSKESFHHKKLWQKSLIVVAGPVFNFLFAMLVFFFLFFFYGKQYILPEVTAVEIGSPAQLAGMRVGDIITHINDEVIHNFVQVQRIVSVNNNKPLYFIVEREGVVFELKITPIDNVSRLTISIDEEARKKAHKKVPRPVIGIKADKIFSQKYSLAASIAGAFGQTFRLIGLTFESLWQIVTGKLSWEGLGGPIKIAQYSAHSVKEGAQAMLWFVGVLSLNLGVMNLLPIPLLDGGHLFFYLIEAIRGSALPIKWQNLASRLGMAILSSLMLFVILNDIRGLL